MLSKILTVTFSMIKHLHCIYCTNGVTVRGRFDFKQDWTADS